VKFSDLSLSEPLLRALSAEGYTVPTPIQAKAIPPVLDGRDVLGCAQTGTGKTAAFALPILNRLTASPAPTSGQAKGIRVLVLSPTRELAVQIDESFRTYGKHLRLRHAVIFGGVGQGPQVQALRGGLDVCVATPGRLCDLMNQGFVNLSGVEVLVLDEADRMLDMGFIHDIRRIVAKLPGRRQNLMFSATMPAEIRSLAHSILRNPVTVEVAPVAATADKVEQSVYFVEKRNKPHLLAHLIRNAPIAKGIVFTRTKHGADRVVRHLHRDGIPAEAIHGNKSQNARQRALNNFKIGKIAVLIASDIAARGIDVDGITHVVNYDLSNEPETYVHRIGRTARAGASGLAVSFCDPDERTYLRDIERLIRQPIPVRDDHPRYPTREERALEDVARPPRQERSYGSHRSSQHSPHASSSSRHAPKPQRHAGARAVGTGVTTARPAQKDGGHVSARQPQSAGSSSPAHAPAAQPRPLHGGWTRRTKPNGRRFR
jgi:ATP-dependent RNA helicase RhlE